MSGISADVGLSIVIPTHRRPQGLDRLLGRLRGQIHGRPERRVIIVNDGSHDADYATVIERHRDFVQYRAESVSRGPAGARNLGASFADRDFLVFIDDDCEPPSYWLDWLSAVIAEHPEIDVVGGTTIPTPSNSPGFFESFLSVSGFHPQPAVHEGNPILLVTANIAVRRRTFESVGGFDEKMRTTEDRNLTYRLGRSGAAFYIDPHWHVHHDMTTSPWEHFQRYYHYGRGIRREMGIEQAPPDRRYWPQERRPRFYWIQRAKDALRRARERVCYDSCPPIQEFLFPYLSALTLLAIDAGFVREERSADSKSAVPRAASSLNLKRIAFISPASNLYGAERSLIETLRQLDRTRFDPQVIVVQEGELGQAVRAMGVGVRVMPWLAGSFWKNPVAATVAVARFAWFLISSQIQIVELNYVGTPCLSYPLLASRLTDRAFVFRNRHQATRLTPFQKFLLSRRTLLLPTSQASIAHWFNEGGFRWRSATLRKRLRFIPVGRKVSALDRVELDRAPLRELGVPDGARIVGMVAAIDPNKRQDLFFKTAAIVGKRHRDAWFVLVGGPYYRPGGSMTEYESSLRRLVQELGIADRVVFAGYRQDAARIMKNFEAIVLPSKKESFGGVLVEAMALGVPVVASDVDGIPEVVGRDSAGLLVAGDDPASYAEAVLSILEDPRRAEKLRRAGRARVKRFDSAAVARRLEQCYCDLASGQETRMFDGAEQALVEAAGPVAVHYTPRPPGSKPRVDDPHFIGERERSATCAGVAWLGGARLATTNLADNSVHLYRFDPSGPTLELQQTLADLDGLDQPENIAVSPDGVLLAATNCRTGAVHLYDIDRPSGLVRSVSKAVIQRADDAYAHGVAFSPCSKMLLYSNVRATGSLLLHRIERSTGGEVRTTLQQEIQTEFAPSKPKGIAFSPDGRFVAVGYGPTGERKANIARAFVAIHSFDAERGLSPAPLHISDDRLGLQCAESVCFLPDASHLIIADQGTDRILFIRFDPRSGAVGREAWALENPDAGIDFPHQISLSRDGGHLAVANFGDDKVAVYSIRKRNGVTRV